MFLTLKMIATVALMASTPSAVAVAIPAAAPAPFISTIKLSSGEAVSLNLKAPLKHAAGFPSRLHEAGLFTRQERCDWNKYCLPLYLACVKSCDSLDNGDCFDAQTDPACEGCNVRLVGCP